MGYYSEVAVILNQNNYYKVLDYLKEKGIQDISLFTNKNHLFILPSGNILIYFDYIKWYGERIDSFEEFLRTLEDNEYLLVEIGEDYDHNRVDGWIDDDYMWIERHIFIEGMDYAKPFDPTKYYIIINLPETEKESN